MTLKTRRRMIVRRSQRRPVLNGLARIFDFSGSLNVPAKSLPPDVADQFALWADWKAVGDDLRAVVGDRVCSCESSDRHTSGVTVD